MLNKSFLLLLFLATAISSYAQFSKSVTVSTTVNFNISLGGLGADDAGVGVNAGASFFSKNRLQLIVETGFDHFFGDKVLHLNTLTGEEAKTNVYSIKAGPQFFINKILAISGTIGPAWHKVREFEYTTGVGFKYGITGFFSNKRNVIVKLFIEDIPANFINIVYLGLGTGIRF